MDDSGSGEDRSGESGEEGSSENESGDDNNGKIF